MPRQRSVQAPRASEETLAALFVAIFDGTYALGDTLPPERVLAERYGVSRIVVRQAIHRLHDAGLVKASQGGATRVLDPGRADARALELVFRFGSRLGGARQLRLDLIEYQELYGLALLEGAFRRGTDVERRSLLARVEDTDLTPTPAAARALDRAVWRALTTMCRNPIFRMEMALFEQWVRDDEPLSASPAALRGFYHGLATRLVAREDPIPFFLAHTRSDAST